MSIAELYERLIERDVDDIAGAVREFRATGSSHDLFLAVARFAILAYAPSQHAKHAVLATLAAWDLRDDCGDRWDDILAECARYTAESRQPWSEPPILDPPPVDADQPRDVEALRAAVAAHDRLAAEKWLAARMDDENLAADLFTVASDDFEDLGHKLIVTSAALKLAAILGDKGRFAALRIALWEMTAYDGERYVETGADASNLFERLVDNAVAADGSLEAMHLVFLHEAAKGTPVFARVCDYLCSGVPQHAGALKRAATPLPVYRLARDYGQYLKTYALRDERLSAAAFYNLEHAPSFADWSFA